MSRLLLLGVGGIGGTSDPTDFVLTPAIATTAYQPSTVVGTLVVSSTGDTRPDDYSLSNTAITTAATVGSIVGTLS